MRNGDKRTKGKDEEAEPEEPQVVDLVRPLLRRCAAKKVTAIVTDPEAMRTFEATFKQASSNHVTFVLDAPMDPQPLVGTVCTVSFYFEGHASSFCSHTFLYQSEGRLGPLLTMNVPESVSTVEARRVYRIPADEEVPVTVVVKFRGAKITGPLVDISRMGLRFSAERMSPRATRGVDVDVLLQWDGEPVRVSGRIASILDNECAVGLSDESEVKESGYLRIVSRQERVALQRRREEDEASDLLKSEPVK